MTPQNEDAGLVYYARYKDLIKIGTTRHFKTRIQIQGLSDVLAVEPGYFKLESARHEQFRSFHSHDEWFHPGQELLTHIAELADKYPIPAFTPMPRREAKTFRIPGDLRNAVGDIAREDRVSAHEVLMRALREYFARRGREGYVPWMDEHRRRARNNF